MPCLELELWLDLLAGKLGSSLDSYNTALPEFTPERLSKLEKTILTVIDDIEKLRRTPLVSELRSRGKFPKGDLLRTPLIPANAPFGGSCVSGQWQRNS